MALVLGAIAWMLVTWVENPFREDWLSSSLPVEVAHTPSGLVEVGVPGDVRVRLRAGQDAWSHAQASDFKASIDLSKQTAGIHSVDVKVETSGDYQVVDWEPRHVTVRLEPLVQREIPVQLQLTGKLPDGFVLTSQSLTPDTLTISGEQDLAETISQAAVGIDLDGIRGDVTESVAPKLVDDKGQPVANVQFSPSSIRISLAIDRQIGVKTVPVRVITSGQVASGYWLSGLTVTPQTITITGGPAALGQVDYIDLPPLDLSGAKDNVSRTTTITAGSGYSLVGAADVEVKAVIQPLRTTEVLPLGIAVQGLQGGLEARLAPSTVEVTLGGLVPALSALKPGDVSATVDVSGLAAGTHNLAIRLNAPASVALDAARPDHVSVTISPPATSTPSPVPPSPSSSGAAVAPTSSAVTTSSPAAISSPAAASPTPAPASASPASTTAPQAQASATPAR